MGGVSLKKLRGLLCRICGSSRDQGVEEEYGSRMLCLRWQVKAGSRGWRSFIPA